MIKKTKNMSENKLTPEELQEFKEIQIAYQKALVDLGSLDYSIHAAEAQLDELKGEKLNTLLHITTMMAQQQEISRKLGDKYGEKQVDLETGELK
jgi:hypothetical protein